MSGDNREDLLERIHAFLTKVGEETRQGLIPVDKFTIDKVGDPNM